MKIAIKLSFRVRAFSAAFSGAAQSLPSSAAKGGILAATIKNDLSNREFQKAPPLAAGFVTLSEGVQRLF